MESRKLGPEFKRLLDGDDDAMVDVLIRMDGEPTTEGREALAALGVEIRTVAGDVVTARLPLGSLSDLTDRPEVLYAEPARPLHPDEPD